MNISQFQQIKQETLHRIHEIAADIEEIINQYQIQDTTDDLQHKLEILIMANIVSLQYYQDIIMIILDYRYKCLLIKTDAGHLDRFARIIISIFKDRNYLSQYNTDLLYQYIDYVQRNGLCYKDISQRYFEQGQFCKYIKRSKPQSEDEYIPKGFASIQKRALMQIYV